MILNALGFTSRPLYLTPEFFANKLLDRLLRPGPRAEMLNDDGLGQAMFEEIDVLPIPSTGEIRQQVLNLKPVHR